MSERQLLLLSPDFSFKANILIDQNGHACLADFGFLTIVLVPTNPTASDSFATGGTTRWMSPELLDPDLTGPEGTRLTKQSDCYALGMVIYEVLSGQAPFTPFNSSMVMLKVIRGERPGRPNGPEGARFTDNLWQTLNRCWESQPDDRPSAEAVLECLEQVSENGGVDKDRLDNASDSFGMLSWFDLCYLVPLLCGILWLSRLDHKS